MHTHKTKDYFRQVTYLKERRKDLFKVQTLSNIYILTNEIKLEKMLNIWLKQEKYTNTSYVLFWIFCMH